MKDRKTTPIVNVLKPRDITDEFVKRYLNLGMLAEGTLVEWHKSKLGRQDRTWVGVYRYWIWEDEDFRIYVSNRRGLGFEVPVGYSSRDALRAWEKYERLMKI